MSKSKKKAKARAPEPRTSAERAVDAAARAQRHAARNQKKTEMGKKRKAENDEEKSSSAKRPRTRQQEATAEEDIPVQSTEDVVVITDDEDDADDDDDEDESDHDHETAHQLGKAKPKKPKSKKKLAKAKRAAEAKEQAKAMATAIERAFTQQRAVLIRLDYEEGSTRHLGTALVENDGFRNMLYKLATTSPLTAPAYVAQNTGKSLRSWCILCIFPDHAEEAQRAETGLRTIFNALGHDDVNIMTSRSAWKSYIWHAGAINANRAVPSRGEQGDHDCQADGTVAALSDYITQIKTSINWVSPKTVKSKKTKKRPPVPNLMQAFTEGKALVLTLEPRFEEHHDLAKAVHAAPEVRDLLWNVVTTSSLSGSAWIAPSMPHADDAWFILLIFPFKKKKTQQCSDELQKMLTFPHHREIRFTIRDEPETTPVFGLVDATNALAPKEVEEARLDDNSHLKLQLDQAIERVKRDFVQPTQTHSEVPPEQQVETTEKPAAPSPEADAMDVDVRGPGSRQAYEARLWTTDNNRNSFMVEQQFREGCTLLIDILPKKEDKTLVADLFEKQEIRRAIQKLITSLRATQEAFITFSKATKSTKWFVLCSWSSSRQARAAIPQLERCLRLQSHKELNFQVVNQVMDVKAITRGCDYVRAVAPRDSSMAAEAEATEALDRLLETTKENIRKEREPRRQPRILGEVTNAIEKSSESALTMAVTDSLPTPSVAASNSTVPAKNSFRMPESKATQVQPPQHIDDLIEPDVQAMEVDKAEIAEQVVPSNKENMDLPAPNAAAEALSHLTYQELQALQIRYLGEVEPGIPVHGCILCGQRDHLWEICPGNKCQHCGEVDKHLSRACPKVKKCAKCHESGHTSENCPSKLKRTAADGFHCDRCGEDTHADEDCSYSWRGTVSERLAVKKAPYLNVSCYNCAARDHWGGDCPKPREIPRTSDYDIFSAKEATKYLDASAPTTNLLPESLATCQKQAGQSTRANGVGHSYNFNYGPQYAQQPREQAISYNAPPPIQKKMLQPKSVIAKAGATNSTSHNVNTPPWVNAPPRKVYTGPPWAANVQTKVQNIPPPPPPPPPVNLALPAKPPSSANLGAEPKYNLWDLQQQPDRYGVQASAPTLGDQYQSLKQARNFVGQNEPRDFHQDRNAASVARQNDQYTMSNYQLELTNRQGVQNRGNDGYVQYNGNSRSAPQPVSRQHDYRQRDDFYGGATNVGQQFERYGDDYFPAGHNSRGPPPPPQQYDYGPDYGRRQTFHAVPPPPPPDNRSYNYVRPEGRYGAGRR